jgi:hypothetical protein
MNGKSKTSSKTEIITSKKRIRYFIELREIKIYSPLVLHGITACVTHLYVLNFYQQLKTLSTDSIIALHTILQSLFVSCG